MLFRSITKKVADYALDLLDVDKYGLDHIVAGTRVHIGEYDIDILDVQDNMIKQVKVFPVKPLRESVAE